MTALELVRQQAEDDGLWFQAQTSAEAYLQQELRKLHAAIETPIAYEVWSAANPTLRSLVYGGIPASMQGRPLFA